MDDRKKRGPADAERVNVNEQHEVSYWTKKFGCTVPQLKNAVFMVGVMTKDVQKFLKAVKSA